MNDDLVVLVDTRDNEIGAAPKMEVHRDGRLHRAISVFVFSPSGEILLQRRADGKYHSGGLWTNACCSHPRPGERPHAAAIRRLQEEMGLQCTLRYSFSFVYRAELGDGWVEHELDHVYYGTVESDPDPDSAEVREWRWSRVDALETEIARDPDAFTAWFPMALTGLLERWTPGTPGIDPSFA